MVCQTLRKGVAALWLCLAFLLSLPSQAQPDQPAQGEVDRRQAAELAREHFEGRILNVRLDEKSGDWLLRMEHQGVLFDVRVSSIDGRVRGPGQEDEEESAR